MSKWDYNNVFTRFEIEDGDIPASKQLLGKGTLLSDTAFEFLKRKEEDDDADCATRPVREGERKSRWIILPDSVFRQRWLQVTLIVALYIIWVTPVRVGFDLPAEGAWFWVEGLIDLFFYIDLVLNFLTAFEDYAGDIVCDHKKIARQYLKSWFIIDLLATFPVDYIVRAVEGTWRCSFQGNCYAQIINSGRVDIIRILRVLRIFRIIWIVKHFQLIRLRTLLGPLHDDLYALLPLVSILELLLILLYLGHVSGCFFYLLSTPRFQSTKEQHLIAAGELHSWMASAFGGDKLIMAPVAFNYTGNPGPEGPFALDPGTKNWYLCPSIGYDMIACPGCDGPKLRCRTHYHLCYRYITSMYWAYTTMTTVGYGDISSVTMAEKVWAIIVMIISGFFFSYVISRMASVVNKLDAKRQVYDDHMGLVATFLKDTSLPKDLSIRVIDFFRKQNLRPYDRSQVLAAMPFDLKSKILRHLYAKPIQSIPILYKNADDEIYITDVCLRLNPYNCPAKTFVYQRGESNADVFILLRGELHVLDLDQETFLFRIPEGSMFGEGSVLRHREGFDRAKRTEHVFCKTACSMLRIAQEDVLDLMEHYPDLLTSIKKLNKSRVYRMHAIRKAIADGDEMTLAEVGTYINAAQEAQNLPVTKKWGSKKVFSAKEEEHGVECNPTEQLTGVSPFRALKETPLLEAEPLNTGETSRQASRKSLGPLSPRPTQTSLHSKNPGPGSEGECEMSGALVEEIAKLKKMMANQQQALVDELAFHQYLIHQIPGRIMNHMVMVLGQPTEEQKKLLEKITLEWNNKYKWNL